MNDNRGEGESREPWPLLGAIILSQQCISELQIFLETSINKTEVFVCSSDDSCIGEDSAAVPTGTTEKQLAPKRAPASAADSSMCHLLLAQQVNFIIFLLFNATGGEILAFCSAVRYQHIEFQRTPFWEGAHRGAQLAPKKTKNVKVEGRKKENIWSFFALHRLCVWAGGEIDCRC